MVHRGSKSLLSVVTGVAILVIGFTVFILHYWSKDIQTVTFHESNSVGLTGLEYSTIEETLTYISRSRILHIDIRHDIEKFLKALHGRVQIMKLPPSLSTETMGKCDKLWTSKPPLIDHQHSLELRFPAILREMSESAERQRTKRISTLEHTSSTPFDPLITLPSTQSGNPMSPSPSPLLIYLETFVYHAIYCTDKKRGKEDWTKRDPYWLEVSNAVTSTLAWKKNSGTDFLTASSHPQSGPSRIHPSTLSKLHRISFLRTDFDVSGSTPKDIVVPYYADQFQMGILEAKQKKIKPSNNEITSKKVAAKPATTLSGSAILNSNAVDRLIQDVDNALSTHLLYASKMEQILRQASRPIFLFFAGTNAPLHGLREELGIALSQNIPPGSKMNRMGDIIYTMEHVQIPYIFTMVQAKFCLVIRGDTSSSRRLFSAIQAGCIPVIISDWISLPFAKLVDYSKFSFTFSESIVSDAGAMIRVLREVSEDRYQDMFQSLMEARSILLFDGLLLQTTSEITKTTTTSSEVSQSRKSLLNPVTLALIESLMRRQVYCKDLYYTHTSSMCQQILNIK